MDIGRALSFPFKDAEWVKKILIGGLITLIPFIGSFVAFGYAIEVVRRAYQNDDTLPEWDDFGGYLTRGFLGWVGALVWAIPLILIGFCAFIPAIALSGDDSGASGAFFLFGYCLIIPLAIIFQAFVLPILLGRYAVERNFGAMFQFSEVIEEIRRAGSALLMVLVVAIVATFVAQLGLIACFIGIIFTTFYSYLAIAHAAGQAYRRARGLSDIPPAAPAF